MKKLLSIVAILGMVAINFQFVPVAKAEDSESDADVIPVIVYVDDDYTSESAGGHTWDYDAFATISDGITAVDTAGTVNVAAGEYQEDIVIGKSLTLQGAGKTETTILRDASVDQVVLIQASDVIITDFKIDGGGTAPYAVNNLVALSTVGASLPYERIAITDSHLLHSKLSAVYLGGKVVTPTEDGTLVGEEYTVNDNTIEYFGCDAECSDDPGAIGAFKALDVEIKGNTITNANPDPGYAEHSVTGIYFMDYTGGTIEDNDISHVYGGIMINSNVEETYVTDNTISVTVHGISQTESFAKIHITRNTISTRTDSIATSAYQHGINLGGDGDSWASIVGYEHEVDNLQHEVLGNTITGDSTANSRGIRVKPGMIDPDWGASGTVNGNTISNYATGLAIWGKGNGGGDLTSHVHVSFADNNITGCTIDGAVTDWTGADGSINAENNWWGHDSGPDSISVKYDYAPYHGASVGTTAKAITAFTIASQEGTTTITEEAKTITLTLPFGTTTAIATFTTTGTSVKVGETTQVSGTTSNNFTSPVDYIVYAIDGSHVHYTVTATINTNAVPISSSVLIKQGGSHVTTIGLTENTTSNVVITATVTDGNGCSDLVSVSVKLFRTSQTSTGDANANYRYIADTVTQLTCVDLVATYSATIPVQYYAEPTDEGSIYDDDSWSAEVIPTDSDVTGTTESNDTAIMETNMAMSVTTPISYGAMSMGDNTGTADKDTTVTNTGNGRFATYVDGYGLEDDDGYSMVCDTGNIPLENEKWSMETGVAYGSRTDLTDTSDQVTGSFVDKSTDGSNYHGHIYWGFAMPGSGVLGSCHGKVVFTPIFDLPV